MLLIADSGSTKTSWRYIDSDNQIYQARTIGFNPYLESVEGISSEIIKSLLPQLPSFAKFSQVFYYGTGCGQELQANKMKDALQSCFSDARISVSEDMLGAARGLCGRESGIVCILGTGSNSCFYDGEKITQIKGGLGLILGDEGSGATLGKQLVKDYLDNCLPNSIKDKFEKRFKLTSDTAKGIIFENVYSKPYPNRYLASFAKFLADNKSDAYCSAVIHQCFLKFFENTIAKYPNNKNYKIHFTGSIAFYLSDYLRRIANEQGFTIGNIVEEPIAGLTLYHSFV
jgi:N-acetylglucosamine kinase-like BadF-type ATPase